MPPSRPMEAPVAMLIKAEAVFTDSVRNGSRPSLANTTCTAQAEALGTTLHRMPRAPLASELEKKTPSPAIRTLNALCRGAAFCSRGCTVQQPLMQEVLTFHTKKSDRRVQF